MENKKILYQHRVFKKKLTIIVDLEAEESSYNLTTKTITLRKDYTEEDVIHEFLEFMVATLSLPISHDNIVEASEKLFDLLGTY